MADTNTVYNEIGLAKGKASMDSSLSTRVLPCLEACNNYGVATLRLAWQEKDSIEWFSIVSTSNVSSETSALVSCNVSCNVETSLYSF